MNWLFVGLGGALGAISRFALNQFTYKVMSISVFWCTLCINLIGCFAMGLLMTLMAEKGFLSSSWRLFLCVGLLGGFTTFSSFGYETLTLLMESKFILAFTYAVVSLIVGVLSAGLGVGIARLF